MRLAALTACALALLSPLAAVAQVEPDQSTRQEADPEARAAALQARAFEAIRRGDLPEAERLLRDQLALDPDNFVIYYNIACVRSLRGEGADACEWLVKAVEHGFVDRFTLTRDPQLRAARREDAFRRLIEAWPRILDRHLETNLRVTRDRLTTKTTAYTAERDTRLRVAFLSAFDATSFEQARADLSRLFDWGVANVFPELGDQAASADDAWTVVLLPTPRDFTKWLRAEYGPSLAAAGIGGSYVHDQKRLVAQDLGATLRHEFFHVLHWRSATRLGQDHPIWIQEGLCSLVEDYESVAAGAGGTSLRPVASWRTNIAKRLLQANRLMPLKQLATTPRDRFTSTNPLAHYAQARAFFLYLADTGKLRDWYAAYTRDHAADPTGLRAIEAALGKDLPAIEADYRAWLRALPTVAEQIKPGRAGLGVEVDPGTGDGPTIAEIPPRDSAARAAGLRRGDAITAIDGKPTRDLNELVRILGEHQVGDEVEVSFRRGKTHATARVKLGPR
ncbi:MAG: PDZ domain-containing protein [Phycisphaerae bacterium]|nr:PDZ domain-containing protein [Phycisphaerae bacterium]